MNVMARALTALFPQYQSNRLWTPNGRPKRFNAGIARSNGANPKVEPELSDPNRFLIQSGLPQSEPTPLQRQIQSGGIFVHRVTGVVPPGVHLEVPDGEIHHSAGAPSCFGMGRSPSFFVSCRISPCREVFGRRAIALDLSRGGLLIYFRFRPSRSFVPVVDNKEQDCRYGFYAPERGSSLSIVTRIAEVESPETASEHEKTSRNDNGYRWRYEQEGE